MKKIKILIHIRKLVNKYDRALLLLNVDSEKRQEIEHKIDWLEEWFDRIDIVWPTELTIDEIHEIQQNAHEYVKKQV